MPRTPSSRVNSQTERHKLISPGTAGGLRGKVQIMKKIISLLLVVCLLATCCTVFADEPETEETATTQETTETAAQTSAPASSEAQKAADALYLLGLFKGTDKGYELENALTREQGVTMLIRAMGNESKAAASADKCVFEDVLDWAKGYVGFAFENGITKGISEKKFGYGAPLTDAMFLTMLLRALGYEEGEGKDFRWEKPYELAKKVGLIDYTEQDEDFLRGDMVIIIYRMLSCKFKGKDATVASELQKNNVFKAEDYENAKKIYAGTAKLSDFQSGDQPAATPAPVAIIPDLPSGIGGNPGSAAGSGSGSGGGSTGSTGGTHETPNVDPGLVGA